MLRLPAGLPARAARSATSSTATTRARARPTVVADAFDKPNGLAFSPDERVLYVGDSGEQHAPRSRRFDVVDGHALDRRAGVFAVIDPGYPDGIKVDAAGRVYARPAAGVQVFDPGGHSSARSPCPAP